MARQVGDLIGAIYEAALDTGAWTEVLTGIADLAGAENAAIVVVDPRLELSRVVTPRADPGVVEAYGSFWWQHDPTTVATAAIAPGIVTDLGVTGREVYHASPFQNEFWARSGLGAERLASNLYCDGPAFGSFVLQTAPGRDEITAEMRQCFGAVLPHLLRAVQTQRRLQQIDRALLALETAPCDGLMLLDRTARLIWADPAAEALLAEGGPLRLRGGRLGLADSRLSDRLMAAIGACANPAGLSGPCLLSVPCGAAGATLGVEVRRPGRGPGSGHGAGGLLPEAAALLILHHPERQRRRRLDRLMARYGLTPAEARLAVEIARGDGRAAAARRAGISVNTARTHLTAIFAKLGVHRQSEVSLLVSRI